MKKITVLLSGLLVAGILPSVAFADEECSLMGGDEWNKYQDEFQSAVDSEKYDEALKAFEKLNKMCETLPSLNYSVGLVYKNLNDYDNAKKHIKLAIDNPSEFIVSEDYIQVFWFAYYELVNKDEIVFKKDYDALDGKLKESQEALVKSNQEVRRLTTEVSETKRFASETELRRSEIVMWTGTGIGGLGLVMTVVGAALVAKGHTNPDITGIYCGGEKYCTFSKDGELVQPSLEDPSSASLEYKLTSYDKPGMVLLGVGIGMTLAGAAMAGLGAYYYLHPSMDVALSDSVSLSWNVSPTNVQVGLTF